MIRVCYRCKAVLGEIEPLDDKAITHGLCDPCSEEEAKEIRRIKNELRSKIITDGVHNEPIRY